MRVRIRAFRHLTPGPRPGPNPQRSSYPYTRKSTLETEVVMFVHFISVMAICSAVVLYVIQVLKVRGQGIGTGVVA